MCRPLWASSVLGSYSHEWVLTVKHILSRLRVTLEVFARSREESTRPNKVQTVCRLGTIRGGNFLWWGRQECLPRTLADRNVCPTSRHKVRASYPRARDST